MIGANKKKQFVISALVGVGMNGFALSSAFAGGDIGGNCCADLEERVAELEATTARKGNRKVSLRISGHVNRAVLFWDDSVESDAYVVDNINTASQFRFHGAAKIRDGWSAGFLMEVEYDSADSATVSNLNANDDGSGTDGTLDLRHAYWWIKSDDYGRISVGQAGPASYLITWMDTSGTLVANTSDIRLIGGSLFFRNSSGGLTSAIAQVSTQYSLDRSDVVKYDSRTIEGFRLSASWGEDDVSDVALRFARKMGDFKVLFGVAYSASTDEGADFDQVAGSFSAFHIPSGLNLTFGGGDRDTDGSTLDQDYYFVKLGLLRKYNVHGTTALAVSYQQHNEHAHAGGELVKWNASIVQNIDAAAMQLYLSYSNFDYETTASSDYQVIDMLLAGARIKF